ncbi:hypothetical protein PoB_001538200 [Plakobranchus ocellatus]|uniref:Uncharacterized protein n=1 Tax=Plakobranchus ocellatus TaxID=259542 RepID=A0AAV3Z100_9GAST|nr:hypothetical protein PoB_001538200 [Plakobranchus ocellatus]
MAQGSTSSFSSPENIDIPPPAPLLAIDESCNQDPPSNYPTTSESQPQTQQNSHQRRPKPFPQCRAQASEFEAEMLKAAQQLATKKIESDEDEHFFKNLIQKNEAAEHCGQNKVPAQIHMIVLKYVEKASDSAVVLPEQVHQALLQTPVHTSTALLDQHYTKYHTAYTTHAI